jgi:hypothetical protein
MKRVLAKSLLVSAIVASLVYFYLALPNVSLLKNRNPHPSALMELRDQENREKKLPLSRQQILGALRTDFRSSKQGCSA